MFTTWTTEFLCTVCGVTFLDVMVAPADEDDPDLEPSNPRCGACGARDSAVPLITAPTLGALI